MAGKVWRTGNIAEWGITEPSSKLVESSGLLIRQTLVTQGDVAPEQVINCRSEPVTLQPNQLPGWCESVCWCESCYPNKASIPQEINTITKESTKNVGNKREVPDHMINLYECSIQHLNQEQIKQLAEVLTQYRDIFSAFKGDFGRTGLVKHHIDAGNARSVRQPPRQLSFAKRETERRRLTRC